MISIDEALACYDSNVSLPVTEIVTIDDAPGRVLATSPRATVALPPFSQAAVDGYALRTADVSVARDNNPVRLVLGGEIAAGVHDELPSLEPGQCLRVLTGAPIPADCDAVVMQENVTLEMGRVVVTAPVPAESGVNKQAEDMARGQPLGQVGQRVTPGLSGVLARAGVRCAAVYQRPRIGVLITGDEIVPVNESLRPLRPGEIHDGNGPLIRAWLHDKGYPAPSLQYVRDNPDEVKTALDTLLANCDLVMTNGGISVGDRDYVRAAAERLDVEQLFKGVAQKPGKPLYFGRRDRTLLLGLPGNPGAVVIGLVMHARRILDVMEGMTRPQPIMYPGRLAQPVHAHRKQERLLRGCRDMTPDGVRLTPLAGQAAHMISNLQTADTLVRIPASDEPFAAGSLVEWTPL